jgi:protein-S-isoprenylcysteine O-methyltransferase Ste14
MNLALTRGLATYGTRLDANSRVRRITGDQVGRVFVVLLFASMATRLAQDAAVTGHVTGILLVASEALVVALTMLRRPAAVVDRTAGARLLTIVSTFGPPLVRPASAAAFAPDAITLLISGMGLAVVVIGKLSLGRSFGLAPANRGVVSTGLYRLVRHPIYLGYLVTHIGFVIANPIDWNVAILAVADAALLMRAVREERTLRADPAYVSYMERVRWRVVPGVF